MKKHNLLLAFTLCLSLLFVMCGIEEQTPIEGEQEQIIENEEELSQDDKLTTWIKSNSRVFATYNREEIGTYPRGIQKAILRSFSPEKRRNIWQSKVDHLMSISDFSTEEKNHLRWFAETFKTLAYDKAFDKDLSQELHNKVIEGMEKFGWSKTQVHKMFFTIENITDSGPQKSSQKSSTEPIDYIDDKIDPETGPHCECYYDLGCPTWDCDSGNNCDDSSDNPHDCGVFGGTDCDGNCD